MTTLFTHDNWSRDEITGGTYDELFETTFNTAPVEISGFSIMNRGLKITETGIELYPDRFRVIAGFFAPGRQEVRPGNTRAARLCLRICQLDEQTVVAAIREIEARYSDQYPNLHDIFIEHAVEATSHIDLGMEPSMDRRLLLGALFTREYSIQASSVCNPSAVLHPVQDGSGDAAFILSIRCIGGEHFSTIGFRTGRISPNGGVTIDEVGSFPRIGRGAPGLHYRSVFETKLAEFGHHREDVAFVLGSLPAQFYDAEFNAHLGTLADIQRTQPQVLILVSRLREIAQSSYGVDFPGESSISERVLWPRVAAESHGIEDARFVRFMDESGDITYYATYTAFGGTSISQQLIETKDFATFNMSPLAGSAAYGKGLALFPRKINGQYVALSRSDQETNAITFSDDLHCWKKYQHVQAPIEPWEILQLGNCGSPIETKEGWLVITHGVGAMRAYSLGAILLDLDHPQRVLARLKEPLISPREDRRDVYIPNVVYSCGAFAHNDTLVLPYGSADETISIATVSIDQLLHVMRTNP
ncbi:MAG TPA: hypothetical protein VMV52_10080 [Candidatus Nanopelagicaceae bacterium]|nr:hypothetical protein [Candidatus Nanopelagicaceae bacterium]